MSLERYYSFKSFWKLLKSVIRKSSPNNAIGPETWFTYFQSLLNPISMNVKTEFDLLISDFLDTHTCDNCVDLPFTDELLSGEITEREVKEALKCLRNGKATGLDGVPAEFYKLSGDFLVPYLLILFNNILDTGVFPDSWNIGMILSLYKSGKVNEPNNYRGISVLNTMGKIFAFIIEKRLRIWMDVNDMISEAQAGFRSEYATTDNIFVLQALCSKYLCKPKGRFYCAFVDFRKAFDYVDRKRLLYLSVSKGCHGKLSILCKNMYSSVKACVKTESGVTPCFDTSSGVRQGCILSPVFFIFFINELVTEIYNECHHGVFVSREIVDIMLLLFADDVALFSYFVAGLQKQLNVLHTFCIKWGLQVNLEKTNVIVFRNGGIVSKHERWIYGGITLKTVSYYKYLGLMMSSRLMWTVACNTLAIQATKALFPVYKLFKDNKFISFKTACCIFDCKISPILLYGSEIWGYNYYECIERVHTMYFKRFLCVGKYASNKAVLGETGRSNMYIHSQIRVIKYWIKLLKMGINRYPLQCYKMMKQLDEDGKTNWVSYVRQMLFSYGFSFVWISQDFGNERLFLFTFKQRLLDVFQQNWQHQISSSHFLNHYASIKSLLQPELYIYLYYKTNPCYVHFVNLEYLLIISMLINVAEPEK